MKGTTISSFLHPTFLWDCAWVIFLFIPFPIIEHPISFPNCPLQVVLSVMYIKIFLNVNGHFNQQIVPRLFCVHQTKYSSWNVFQLVSFLFLGYWRHMAEVLSHNLVFFSLLVLGIGEWHFFVHQTSSNYWVVLSIFFLYRSFSWILWAF